MNGSVLKLHRIIEKHKIIGLDTASSFIILRTFLPTPTSSILYLPGWKTMLCAPSLRP
jgi:hypothetical protein